MDKNNTQMEPYQPKSQRNKSFPIIKQEDLTSMINFSGFPDSSKKYTINKLLELQDPLYTTPLNRKEIQNIFLPNADNLPLQLSQRHQNLRPVIRQFRFWYSYKTNPIRAELTILGNKTILQYF